MSDSSGNDFLSRAKKWLRDNVGKTILIAVVAWFVIGGVILDQLPKEYKSMPLARMIPIFPLCFVASFIIYSIILEIRSELMKYFPKILIDIAFIALFAAGINFFIIDKNTFEPFIKPFPVCLLTLHIFFMWLEWRENQPKNQTQETHTLRTEQSATVNQNAALPETAANRTAVETTPVPAPVIIQITPAEVAQQELDAFWNSPKNAAEIGRLYERYIGYLNEMNGFNVEYFGIEKGNQDLGRDLICRKQNHTVIIQCKNWSQASTIYAQPIYQLYGTTAHYAKLHPDETVECAFLTTTRRFENNALSAARALGVTLKSLPMPSRFPIIKCKIHREFNGEKRHYYLPGQGLYDSIRLDLNNGDCFCQTVAEAEQAGFTWIKAKYKFSNL